MRADVTRPEEYLTNDIRYFRRGKKDTLICDFDRIFNIEKKNLNMFVIPRSAFYKKAGEKGLICDTLNILMEYYDEDKELITSYLNIKTMIDLESMTYSFTSFLDDIVNILLSESMVEKINLFVDEQYRIDLETSEDKGKYQDNPQQFTNKHGKILMAISTGIKVIIPLVSHYYSARNDMVRGVPIKSYLYACFYALFPLFEKDTSMYNKIHATVDSAVTTSTHVDAGMWKRLKKKGKTPVIIKMSLTKMVILDLMYKYTFDEIMINLNYVGIRTALKFIVEGKDTLDYVDINTKRSDSRMSGLEQLEISAAKVDETDVIVFSKGSSNKVKKLASKYGVEIRDSDIEFYDENLEITAFQVNLILQFFADDFRGLENMKFIKRRDFFILVLIIKHELKKNGFQLMHQLVTGNVSKTVKGRKVGSKKITKIKNSPRYQRLMEQFADVRNTVGDNMVMRYVPLFVNTPLTYVDHEKPDLLGEEIYINDDLVIDEVIRLIESL